MFVARALRNASYKIILKKQCSQKYLIPKSTTISRSYSRKRMHLILILTFFCESIKISVMFGIDDD